MESVLKHRPRRQKGLTLIEVVVALAIISIVSFAVVSIAVNSTSALSTARINNFFSRETDGFASFYLTYNDEGFHDAIEEVTGTVIDGTNNEKVYYNVDCQYSTSENYHYYVNFSYDSSTLTLIAYDVNNNSIFSRSVTR